MLSDLPNAKDVYEIYSVMFPQKFHVRRKSVIFSAVLAGEPWSWKVIGITPAALEALSKGDYRYAGKTICRAHIINRIDTARAIFDSPKKPLPFKRLFRMLVRSGRTIITTKSENKFAAQLPYVPIGDDKRLFENKLISFKYGRNERNALRDLHAEFKHGKISLVRQNTASSMKTAKRASEPAPKADGKRVIQGTIGKSKYLLDANSGEIVLELKSGRDVIGQAAAVDRVLIPRREASKHAVRSLVQRWKQAKRPRA